MASKRRTKNRSKTKKKRSVSQQRESRNDLLNNNLYAVDQYPDKDRRRFDPNAFLDTPKDPIKYIDKLIGSDRIPLDSRKKRQPLPLKKNKRPPYWRSEPQFISRRAKICQQRKKRRETLFKLKKAGKGIAGPKRQRRSAVSDITCRR